MIDGVGTNPAPPAVIIRGNRLKGTPVTGQSSPVIIEAVKGGTWQKTPKTTSEGCTKSRKSDD